MKTARETCIAGVAITPFLGKGNPDFITRGHPDFGKRENPTLEEHLAGVVGKLLSDSPLAASAIQRGYVGNFAGELFNNQGHLGAMVARADSRLAGIGMARVEAACASGGAALVAGMEAIAAGLDVVLVAGAEVQTSVRAREGADFLARAAHYASERKIDDFTFPALFARRARAYAEAYKLDLGELAHFTVKAYRNANRNPLAHMRAGRITFEEASSAGEHNPQFLQNPDLKDYLKVSDCSQVTDGAAALLLASAEGLSKLGRTAADCARVRAYGIVTNPLGEVRDLLRLETGAAAVCEALESGGARLEHVNVAEVHDCFTIAELLMYEAIGLTPPGHGIEAVRSGRTALDGDLPVNTGGGLIGFGHPVGATGIKQAAEIFRQMKGLCGDYQLKQRPALGLMANMGGDDRTCVAVLLENCA
ncbi:MAG: hypothetical protein HY319_02095 [Armatimonadetes bacterium]|nr:hypothetical protein [Armatimonadota bacterium]